MILKLADGVWDELLEGLSLKRQQHAEDGELEKADDVRLLIKTLKNDLGRRTVGGDEVQAFQFRAMINEKPVVLELRIVE